MDGQGIWHVREKRIVYRAFLVKLEEKMAWIWRRTLKCIIPKCNGRGWTGFIWLRLGTVDKVF